MITATATLRSLSPYSQSKFKESEKGEKETHAEFEERTWREHLHADAEGKVYIPPMGMKYAIDEACKRLGIKVPGEGSAKYTKYMEAGFFIKDPIFLRRHDGTSWEVGNAESETLSAGWVQPESFMASSTGKKGKGGGSRVKRTYPTLPEWEADLVCYVLDEKITESVFSRSLDSAGKFVGVGRFRPENQGYYGRFEVLDFKWLKA